MRLTAACASSKLPRIAIAWIFASDGVVICRRCMREVPTLGKNTATSVPSTPAKPCIAAEPVSPLVAVRTKTRRPLAAWRMKTGSIESATSLNAPVLPWKSSRMSKPSAATIGVASPSGKRESRRSTASSRTASGKSPNSLASTWRSASPRFANAGNAVASTFAGTYSPPSGASPWKTDSTAVASIPFLVDTYFMVFSVQIQFEAGLFRLTASAWIESQSIHFALQAEKRRFITAIASLLLSTRMLFLPS